MAARTSRRFVFSCGIDSIRKRIIICVIKVGTIGDDGAFAFSETHGALVNLLIGVFNLILVTDNRARFRLISLDNFPWSSTRRVATLRSRVERALHSP